MEKLISELESLKLSSAGFRAGSYNEGINAALQLLKSSLPTQQDKVVVPPYVDDFLSVGNKAQKLACLVSCKYSILSCDMAEGELKQWLREVSMDDLLSLANGYTVVKEQLYYVKFPNVETNGYDSWLMKIGDGTFELADNNDFDSMQFTEKEIKAIDERYWPFAVPVEEEE